MQFKTIIYVHLSILLYLSFSSCTHNSEQLISERKPIQSSLLENKKMSLPPSVTFCGKTVSLDNFDVRERLDKELIVNTYRHSATIQYLKRANRFFSAIEKQLLENGIPEDMKYLCVAESGLTQATSRSGAKGFWQFMPSTAKEFGLTINEEVDERMNIENSTDAACAYLKNAHAKFDDWFLTAAAYNRGQGGIERDIENQHVNNYFDLHLTEETSRYVFRILALKIVMENPSNFGFSLEKSELYQPIETRTILITESIPNLAIWAIEHGTTYRIVKLLNPWVLRNKLTIKSKQYKLLLPV